MVSYCPSWIAFDSQERGGKFQFFVFTKLDSFARVGQCQQSKCHTEGDKGKNMMKIFYKLHGFHLYMVYSFFFQFWEAVGCNCYLLHKHMGVVEAAGIELTDDWLEVQTATRKAAVLSQTKTFNSI